VITSGPFVLPGERGYVAKHDLLPIASHNITAPFLGVAGELDLGNGNRVEVTGRGWMSKEWGSDLLEVDKQGVDRFVFQLDGETTLSLNRYKHAQQMSYDVGTLSTTDGKVVNLSEDQISIVPLQPSFLGNGKRVPLEWSINIPDYGISLTTQVLNRNLWLPFAIQYWQGAIQATGSHQAKGFMQLSGY
jgi:predicted secreted hydrolase